MERSNHHSLNKRVTGKEDRLVGFFRRIWMQRYDVCLAPKVFDSRLIIDQHNNSFALLRCLLFPDEHQITIGDAGLIH